MEKTELIERRELLQINEKNNSKKNILLLGVNIKQNTFKHTRSRMKKLAYSTDQFSFP